MLSERVLWLIWLRSFVMLKCRSGRWGRPMAQTSTKIGLLGCGSIGSTIAEALHNDPSLNAELVALYDRDLSRAEILNTRNNQNFTVASSFSEFLDLPFHLLMECASQSAVKKYAQRALDSGKDLVIMSVGALMDDVLRERLQTAADLQAREIFYPSGAIGGLDLLRAAGEGKLYSVRLTTRKPPAAFLQAPYFIKHRTSPKDIRSRVTLFEGSATEAVKLFPANVNVAAALSMAGIGGEKTQVKIVADPGLKVNVHEIEIRGDFGTANFTVQNAPHPDNPGTSTLAAFSAIETLRRACDRKRIFPPKAFRN